MRSKQRARVCGLFGSRPTTAQTGARTHVMPNAGTYLATAGTSSTAAKERPHDAISDVRDGGSANHATKAPLFRGFSAASLSFKDSFKHAPSVKGKWILDPRTSKFAARWDVINAVALVITATVTPFEVGFLQPGDMPMFILNRTIDAVFLFDMLLQFFLAYQIDDRNVWEHDSRRIAINYLSGWFAIDLVSVGVSVLDVIALDGDSNGGAWRLEAIRAIRALRLSKMIRLVKARRNHLLQAVRGKVRCLLVACSMELSYWLLQSVSDGFRLLLIADDCFRLLPIASGGTR